MESSCRRTTVIIASGLVLGLLGPTLLFGEEAPSPGVDAVFDHTQTYEIFFSLHPQEIDRLSNVRIVGTNTVGQKTFLKFQTLLNNQREEGLLDLQTVTAIFPSPRPLVVTPELVLDRQPIDREKVKEIRSETVREVIRQAPSMPGPKD